MNYYCGTDIIEVERIKNAILSINNFKNKIYTPSEITYAESKNNITKYECYAGRFAAKEAVYKSLSKLYPYLSFDKIEILNNSNNLNRPYVIIHDDNIASLIKENALSIDISISHIKDYAIAFSTVVCI